MYNFIHFRLQILRSKNCLALAFLFTGLLLQSVSSIAQSLPTGISPLTAPQQFTANLIAVNDGGNITVDGNIAILDNSFSNSVDGADGLKTMDNAGENFDLKRDGVNLVLEQRKLVVTTDTLFFSMSNLKLQSYLLEFYPINMNLPGLTAVLVDKYTNVRVAVALNVAPFFYPFLVTNDVGSFAADRFMVILFQTAFAPLPVNFISIAANKISTGIQINWKVAAESNVLRYSIEKSVDGRNFTATGTVAAATNSYTEKVYNYTDNTVHTASVFYRIKSTDINGNVKYSAIVKVAAGSVKAAINISPNPVKGNILNLQLNQAVKGRYEVDLISADGKRVYHQIIQHAGGNTTLSLSLGATVAKGTYILNVIKPEKIRQAQLLIISN